MSLQADEPNAELMHSYMRAALELADQAAAMGEVPVGAIVVQGDQVVGRGHNRQIIDNDPSAHAEVVALRAAAASIGNYRLSGAALYSTIEPCTMCLGASIHARVAQIIYGAPEPRAGAIALLDQHSTSAQHFNHIPAVISGCLAAECSERIKIFFRERRLAADASTNSGES